MRVRDDKKYRLAIRNRNTAEEPVERAKIEMTRE
jgi:hypothetical protein